MKSTQEIRDIAKYIVTKCTDDGQCITNIQLQHILYAISKRRLHNGKRIIDRKFEKKQWGYMLPDIYYYFCGHGAMPISMHYDVKIKDHDVKIKDRETRQIIDSVTTEERTKKPWER